MITDDKITEIFCAVDGFCKEFDKHMDKKTLLSTNGKVRRYRKASLSHSEIMTILIVFQFGSFRSVLQVLPMWDKIMLRKRCIIETINDMFKNTTQLVHYRHRSINNFIMNMIAALAAYCFFEIKPNALQGYSVEPTNQLFLF